MFTFRLIDRGDDVEEQCGEEITLNGYEKDIFLLRVRTYTPDSKDKLCDATSVVETGPSKTS